MRAFLKNEMLGWRKWEIFWVAAACLIIFGLSIYWHDTVWGIISSISGVLYTIFAGKGKLSAYVFGLINCVLYSVISFGAALYGETILNVFYYIPMMFVGFFAWRKNMNDDIGEVEKQHMTKSGRLWLAAVIGCATVVFGVVLKCMGDSMPYVDSFTTVSSVVAMVVSVKRYSEQWWIWLAVNLLSVYMWWSRFTVGNDNAATLVMWLVYLVNGIIILIKWESDLKKA